MLFVVLAVAPSTASGQEWRADPVGDPGVAPRAASTDRTGRASVWADEQRLVWGTGGALRTNTLLGFPLEPQWSAVANRRGELLRATWSDRGVQVALDSRSGERADFAVAERVDGVQIALAADGTAIVAWSTETGLRVRVGSARGFGPVEYEAPVAGDFRVAAGDDGAGALLQPGEDGFVYHERSPAGTWAAPVTLDAVPTSSPMLLAVALGPRGERRVAYEVARRRFDQDAALVTRYRRADGRWSPPQRLTPFKYNFDAQTVFLADGSVVLGHVDAVGVKLRRARAGGRFGPARTFARPTRLVHATVLAANERDDVLATWSSESQDCADPCEHLIEASSARSGGDFAPATRLSPPGTRTNLTLVAATDTNRRALVAWYATRDSQVTPRRLVVARGRLSASAGTSRDR